ncbi:hypothetical protein [Halobacterium salinarum]|uniref:Uncharacterized protein n=1 Tax=Halobacterium salinarum (strain ATCC 33171 / DSM 3754 / JCM 8978 / NBRC 102687 / NCIMB 764 / 91-R6) TaxID=2597657 RepID=A0A4D6GUS1_HALS9|nr:hypothetical protein [Halobacterium salinarum]QCC45529.1 uncharacterized protein HBSAL_09420 [Halobacterium salinarum]TYO81794.1 hypothetical protein APQ99_00304 [Halobacterium salinarum DSM 3754]
MSELQVVDTGVEPLSRVEFAPDGRVNYADGRLTAVYPKNADTVEYVVAVFNYRESSTVELPNDSVVLSVGEGVVVAAVPADAYGVEGEA